MTKIDFLFSNQYLFIVQNENIFVGSSISSQDYYLNSDDSLDDLVNYRISGDLSDCQLLVELNKYDLISNALGDLPNHKYAHWNLLDYEEIEEGEFTERPFSVDTNMDYVIVHGENRDLYVPRKHGTLYDVDHNECSSLDELAQIELLSFSSSIDEWMFISDEQNELNIQTIENIINNCCSELNKRGILVDSINDLI